MARPVHRHAAPKRRRSRTSSRRALALRTLIPGTGLVAVLVAAAAVVSQSPQAADAVASGPRADVLALSQAEPPTTVSRSAERAPLPNDAKAEAKVKGEMFAQEALAVRADSDGESPELATVAAGEPVEVTGKKKGGWTQIMHNGVPRWVTTSGIAREMPLGTEPCATGSTVENGLQPDTVKVHRAVCAKFPEITRYGGIAGRGEHATGHSLDIMVSSDLGNEIAAFLQDHRAELGIEYLIWRQRIWRPATSAGWRGMSDRGGATANHMDHVHVTTYGTAATE